MLSYEQCSAETVPRLFGVLLLLLGGIGVLTPADAQFISVETTPVATGSQFQLHPSRTRAMGNVTVAVRDSLGDAFVNPAKTARLNDSWVFSAPAYYTITDGDGAARTLSVGGLFTSKRWFGGGSLALQQLDPGPSPGSTVRPNVTFASRTTVAPAPPARTLRETAAENQYATAFGGIRLSSHVAIAGMVQWAGLKAMDGVELLYPGNEGLRQDGHRLDLRVGLLGEWADQSLSLLLLHNRLDMTHDVQYSEGEVLRGDSNQRARWETHIEHYEDRTNTWGLHLDYVLPLGASPWNLGTALTTNRKNHPKIPNYDLMNIPRDPGTSWAYNVGLGVSRQANGTTFGIDLIFEPILSETWANAQETITQPDGGTISPGERRITNDFTFANSTVRIGLRQGGTGWHLAGGLQVHTVRYWMTQTDHTAQSKRDQEERWTEWRLTWGGGLTWDAIRIQYDGHLTLGTGQPGVTSPLRRGAEFAVASDMIVAPRGPMTLQTRKVFTHQVSVIVPIGASE